MATTDSEFLREQLQERRKKLAGAITVVPENASLLQLMQQVDSALERMSTGSYGLCEVCREPVEKERLMADPLVRYCLGHLTAEQQRALEEDLELAAHIQRALLPRQDVRASGWEVSCHYEPIGPVSGDYCDLIQPEAGRGSLFFALGDVSGKGVAASMLMNQLHAMFRSLTTTGVALDQLVGLASRVFCETTMAGQYATLVCGRADPSGQVELCNAGHWPALLVHKNEVLPIPATGLPLGMFGDGEYALRRMELRPGESLFLYTDGLSETQDASNAEYGVKRLTQFVAEQSALGPRALIAACLKEVGAFSEGRPKTDDLSIMVIRRSA